MELTQRNHRGQNTNNGILFFHDPTMLRALGGKLSEENQYGGKRGGFASYHKLKIVQRCVKIREGDAEINL